MVNETNRLNQVVPWKLFHRKLGNQIPPKVERGEFGAFLWRRSVIKHTLRTKDAFYLYFGK